MKTNSFNSGDLLRIKSPRVFSTGNSKVENKQTGLFETKRVYRIEGMAGAHPYGKFLARKRFVCVRSASNTPVFYLYDNYKPDFMGKGYKVGFLDSTVLEKIGKVIDVRKLPSNSLNVLEVKAGNASAFRHYFNGRGLTSLQKIKYYNEAPARIYHNDPGIAYALTVGSEHNCQECGAWFTSTHVDIMHINQLDMELVKRKLENITGYERKYIHIFPAGYACRSCECISVLACWSLNRQRVPLLIFESMLLGEIEEFIK